MSDNENKNNISVDYLIELISSIKSALHSIDDKNSQNNDILIELSKTITILSELYKKQNQDQKVSQLKIDEYKQQILSSNENVNSKVSVINEFKKDSLDEFSNQLAVLTKATFELQDDINYLKNRETQKEIVSSMEKSKELKEKKTIQDSNDGIFSKILSILKEMSDNIGDIYKIMMLVFGVILIILWLTGVISFDTIKNIVQLKFLRRWSNEEFDKYGCSRCFYRRNRKAEEGI